MLLGVGLSILEFSMTMRGDTCKNLKSLLLLFPIATTCWNSSPWTRAIMEVIFECMRAKQVTEFRCLHIHISVGA